MEKIGREKLQGKLRQTERERERERGGGGACAGGKAISRSTTCFNRQILSVGGSLLCPPLSPDTTGFGRTSCSSSTAADTSGLGIMQALLHLEQKSEKCFNLSPPLATG